MSLRARLLLGMVVLVAAGLAVAAVTTYEEQRSFLLNRVDQQVQSGLVPVAFELRLPGIRPTRARGARRFAVRRPAGAPAAGNWAGQPAARHLRRADRPRRQRPAPADVHLRRAGAGAAEAAGPPSHQPCGQPAEAVHRACQPGPRRPLPRRRIRGRGGNTVVVAVSLRETDDTLHRLVMVEGLVGAGVILALVLLGWVVIRIGLRPLERIGRVAAGDRRRGPVPPGEPGRPAHRGRAPGSLAERDAGTDRARLPRPAPERGSAAPLPRRRLPRAAHAAGVDPRLRGAVPAGRRR